MIKNKHIFAKELRAETIFWGLYVALVGSVLLSVSIIDDYFSSVESGPSSFTLLLFSLGMIVVMGACFSYRFAVGWCLVTAVFMIQVGRNIFGIFGVLSDAKLDGEHIIGMAQNGIGTALGIIIVVYLFQPFITELFSLKGRRNKDKEWKKPDSNV